MENAFDRLVDRNSDQENKQARTGACDLNFADYHFVPTDILRIAAPETAGGNFPGISETSFLLRPELLLNEGEKKPAVPESDGQAAAAPENKPAAQQTEAPRDDQKRPETAQKGQEPEKDKHLTRRPEKDPYADQDWVPYHPPGTGLAPGWQKRLAILVVGVAAAVGGIFGLQYLQSKSEQNGEPKNGAITQKQDGGNGNKNPKQDNKATPAATKKAGETTDPATDSNLLRNADQALAQAKAGTFQPLVREIENQMAGQFTYQFTLKTPTDPKAAKAGTPEVRYLKGVVPGAERDKLLNGLTELNMRVESEIRPPVIISAPPPKEDGGMASLFFNGLTIAISCGILYIFYKSYKNQKDMMSGKGGGIGSLTRHNGDFLLERPKERFTSVGGCPEVIDEMSELKKDLESVIKGNQKVYLPRGIILSGGPGTGKTLLARSLAGEVDCPFLQIDSSQSTTAILVGTGQMRVKSAFDSARMARDLHTKMLRSLPGATGQEEGVCILFFDEFDSIGSKRQSIDLGSGADSERKNVVNALLNELDGIDKARNKNIIVMAATNFRDDLDPALMRPGRFTKKVDIPLPTSAEQRLDILEKLAVHLIEHKDKKLEAKESLAMIAKITPGKSGDHLRAILEEAVAIARRDGEREVIKEADLFEAYQRESFGRPKNNLIKADKHELVIRHENGHALCALAGGIGVFLMSSVPRGESAGRVVIDPEGIPEMLATKKDMLSAILLTAGGRAAELEGYGPLGITRGADSDLEQIRNMVTSMISSGLFDGMYSRRIYNHPQSKWDERQTAVVDTIADRAVNAAREVLKAVGEEKMKQLVEDAKSINKELVGLEAQKFYLDRLGPDLLKQMQEIAHKFFNDPLGANAAQATQQTA